MCVLNKLQFLTTSQNIFHIFYSFIQWSAQVAQCSTRHISYQWYRFDRDRASHVSYICCAFFQSDLAFHFCAICQNSLNLLAFCSRRQKCSIQSCLFSCGGWAELLELQTLSKFDGTFLNYTPLCTLSRLIYSVLFGQGIYFKQWYVQWGSKCNSQ